ncbi:eye-specific diacylglycerol kinase isoform X2 [Condylostylus longicornis]|uniref:eye-specific diacylglycerol kinase isoform X2 n=1 Tax=Condylostylus longicornis TaxID=2530218 RepID=UPI00244E0120|nr:eye-specific diacylglycerol kinase isoform X2 [Condylostylus longicornis]
MQHSKATMHRLRTTFTRSRTPTGNEMKAQDSLEVPKQKVRSASFDEMQLEAQREFAVTNEDGAVGVFEGLSSGENICSEHLLIHTQEKQSHHFISSNTNESKSRALLGISHSDNAENSDKSASGSSSESAFSIYNLGPNFTTVGGGKKNTFIGRRASGSTTGRVPPSCWHCYYLNEYMRKLNFEQRFFIDHHELQSLKYSDDSSTSNSDIESNYTDENVSETENVDSNFEQLEKESLPPLSPCNITFTLSALNYNEVELLSTDILRSAPPSPVFCFPERTISSPPPTPSPPICLATEEIVGEANFDTDLSQQSSSLRSDDLETQELTQGSFQSRRRSISRQEAVFIEPTSESLENFSNNIVIDIKISNDETPASAASENPEPSNNLLNAKRTMPILVTEKLTNKVCDIYLTVPDVKRDRAASVDSCFSKLSSVGKTEELLPVASSCFLSVPNINATRSRSVDIVLPTEEQARYKALALTAVGVYGGKPSAAGGGGVKRPIHIVPDWTENAINGDHLWKQTSMSGDLCCLADECQRSGQRMKCSACQLVAHINCIPKINEKTQLACKPTFRDVGIRQYREQTQTVHHWVHRRAEKNKCKTCGKAIQGKLFGSKDVVALTCAWCKTSFHNKESCFWEGRMNEECPFGTFASIIVPPSWIVKLPKKGNFKSSLRTPKKRAGTNKKKEKDKKEKEHKAFIVKPIPSSNITPVIVFINPKSGGNQGVKLLGKFQWILNPRQVFDLTQGGPRMGLELFRKSPQLRVLACGGDGTVGWVLSVLDVINIQPPPAVGVLPLGTGNDLARALGWGGGYTDEPVGKILLNIGKSDPVLLDRWRLDLRPNPDAEPTDDGKDNLPLNVVNNYFSFGVDAHIALEFHEAREAHPERFNSRIRNKMFYGQAGGKDLLQRKWRALSDCVTMECDGQDFTAKLKDHRVHAILFLNIPSYGGGTHPWNNSAGQPPSTEDGLIEVVGLTTYQLPMLQAGAHGTCICQCKTAKIVTTKTIPMQVDGEACRVKPCIIELSLLNKAVLLAKKKRGRPTVQISGMEPIYLKILRITMPDYEHYHHDKEMIKQSATNLGNIEVEPFADLENVRNIITSYLEESSGYPKLSQEWCFVDSLTAERFFRIDRAQEHLHYIMDIANEEVFILDQECATMPQTPDQERSFAAYQQKQERRYMERIGAENGRNSYNTNRSSMGNNDSPIVLSSVKLVGELKIKSYAERLFSFNEDAFGFSCLLEKTTDAVLIAAQRGDVQTLQALYEQGYSLLSIDQNGQTSLHYGTRFNNKNIVKFLITYASRSLINMVDNIKGETSLHLAAGHNYRDITIMLVAAGASLSIRNFEGFTPMMVAFNANALDLAAYLENQERFYGMDIITT